MKPKRHPFLARPFWRDYDLALLLIMAGVTGYIAIPKPSAPRRLGILAVILFAAGLCILCCALAWSIRSAWKPRRDAEPLVDL